jgi:hypothetical protein
MSPLIIEIAKSIGWWCLVVVVLNLEGVLP